ncbi:MAG: type I restriction-modification system endonuclease [Epulopiscium sp. Nuni2H_MBin001]|nr:MAG: type I restriction-modification system endonuclease [Epulopiscium sp. Nuni2H_MBin001]
MKSNFEFLRKKYPVLYNLGSTAEKYLYTDANSCLIKLGMLSESMVNIMIKLDNVGDNEVDKTQVDRIKFYKCEGMITNDIENMLHALRKARNKAVHENYEDFHSCKTLLHMAHNLTIWFNEVYGDYDIRVDEFVLPPKGTTDQSATIMKQEQQIKKLLAKIEKTKPQEVSPTERIEKVKKVTLNLSEAETRYLIDMQLSKVGWEVNTQELRYSKGARPEKGKNKAIAEWPTNSTVHSKGFVDYALFVGEQLIGMIEAKKMDLDIASVIDVQCKEYASCVKVEHLKYTISQWGKYHVPFVYATNGRKYLPQLATKSGIWHLDLRDATNIPKALAGWPSPENLLQKLAKDIAAANLALSNTSYELLQDKDGLNLRDYQIRAITKVEEAIISGKQTALVAMATGTGKTRTILGMIYRFLKAKRFYRILFLVDRTALGEQAQGVFEDVKLESLMSLNDIYNVKGLTSQSIDYDTKIHVATVQSLVKRVLYSEDGSAIGAGDYDLIIIDEAHRGYTLNKELDRDEMNYRNQSDFVSKYREVIDYFDAVKIALTATPALHTTEIFGKPVFNYSYREAVVEGYLVDYDAPHVLETKLSQEGVHYRKGDTVAIYDPVSKEVINSAELADEINFHVEQFNRKIIVPEFNRVVLEEIAKGINPKGDGKTLIYAVNDNHADMIVEILRDIYKEQSVHQDAILKITGKTGDKKRVKEAILKFKNEKYPNIAVTVDLLTTGIDVPKITTIVFMRRVQSRILFEQMLGRATRLCDAINKGHFEIYDAVGVYETLQDVSTMKPVVANASVNFADMMKDLSLGNTSEQTQYHVDRIVTKMRRHEKTMTDEQNENFKFQSGGKTVSQFVDYIKTLSAFDAKQTLINNNKLFDILKQSGASRKSVILCQQDDELISHSRGYGDNLKPGDYLEEFQKFINENREHIEVLNIVCTKPNSLTRKELNALKMELDNHGFTETRLNSAYQSTKNSNTLADIISLVRAQIGAKLVNHEQRIKGAIKKLKTRHTFSKPQSDFLDKIQSYLLKENVIDEDTFNQGTFRHQGGFKRINKIFDGNLDNYMTELSEYLYEDDVA